MLNSGTAQAKDQYVPNTIDMLGPASSSNDTSILTDPFNFATWQPPNDSSLSCNPTEQFQLNNYNLVQSLPQGMSPSEFDHFSINGRGNVEYGELRQTIIPNSDK